MGTAHLVLRDPAVGGHAVHDANVPAREEFNLFSADACTQVIDPYRLDPLDGVALHVDAVRWGNRCTGEVVGDYTGTYFGQAFRLEFHVRCVLDLEECVG